MDQKKYDIVVVGGGGAGLNVAYQLSKFKKYKIAVVDGKSDLLKLSFHTLASFIDIERFDLTRNVVATDITEVVFYSSNEKANIKCKGYIIDKVKLHEELLVLCKKNNVDIFCKEKIEKFDKDEKGNISKIVGKTSTFEAKIFIDATGATGFFSKKFDLQQEKIPVAVGLEYNVKYLGKDSQAHLLIGKVFKSGYGWIFPLNNNRAIIGCGSFNESEIRDMKSNLDEMFEHKLIKGLVQKDNSRLYSGFIPITDPVKDVVFKNVVCVGDSVSQVNPIVGEGYRFVMEAGLIAAPFIDQAIQRDDNSILYGYQKAWNKKYYDTYKGSRILQRLADRTSQSDKNSNTVVRCLKLVPDKYFIKLLKGEVNSYQPILIPYYAKKIIKFPFKLLKGMSSESNKDRLLSK